MNDKVSEAHQAITDIRSMKAQVKSYTDKIADKEIKDYAKENKVPIMAIRIIKNISNINGNIKLNPLSCPWLYN